MSIHLELEEFDRIRPAQRIPNTENRTLQAKVDTTQRYIQSTQNELDEYLIKIQTVEEHLKNVQDELLLTQKLCNARKNETDTEEHMKMFNQREIGRVKLDISRIENELTTIKGRKKMFAEQAVHINQLMNEIESETKWDEQSLKAWIEESMQKDEDIMALMKYTKQDDAKVKDLTLKIERMAEESVKKKRAVDNEILDTTSLQVELDKTAEHFRRSHLHRQELIQRWEQIIEKMHQRDHDVDLLAIQLIKIKAEFNSIEEQLNEKREFYVKEQRNNNDCQLQISIADRQAAKLRTYYDEVEQSRLLFSNELSTLRRVVERTEKDKETAIAVLHQMKRQLTDRRQYLNEVIVLKNELINKKTDILDAKYTAEEKANQMDQLYTDEQEREIALNTRLKFLSEKLYKITQGLFEYQDKEKNLEGEINGSIITLNHLQAKITKLDNDALKQHEILYHQDYEIQSYQRRLNRMKGDKSIEEQAKLQQKIIELQSEMKEKYDEYLMIKNQTKQMQEDIRLLKKYLLDINQEKLNEQRGVDDIDLHDKNSQLLIRKLNDEKDNLLVEEQFMRVEIKRSRSLLHSKADHIMNLETRRLQLQTVIKERRSEISISQGKSRQQIREEEERSSEISTQLHDRIAKIEKLKKRYEILQITMSPPEGVQDDETSQAYYVIKAAREKEELQRKGDELNGKNRKAEHELLALQNTVRILNSENKQIKSSFKKPHDKNEKKKLQILRLENDCKDIEKRLNQADKNVRNQGEIAAISSNQKSARNQAELSIQEYDFELRLLKEFNKKIELLIDQTISMDSDAQYCYNILKKQRDPDEISSSSSISLNMQSNSTTRSSSSLQPRASVRQMMPVDSIQLSIEGSRLSNGTRHRQPKSSLSVKRIVQ